MDTCFDRTLVDLATGTVGLQHHEGDWKMTILLHGESAGDLRGRAFITLDRLTVLIDDPTWQRAIGSVVRLEGGTELDIDDERLGMLTLIDDEPLDDLAVVPVIIRDIYLPPARAHVRMGDLRSTTNLVEVGAGVRASGARVPCAAKCGNCLSCYYERWTARHEGEA